MLRRTWAEREGYLDRRAMRNVFAVEALEPRLLLSGVEILPVACAAHAATCAPIASDFLLADQLTGQTEDGLRSSCTDQPVDLFTGVPTEVVLPSSVPQTDASSENQDDSLGCAIAAPDRPSIETVSVVVLSESTPGLVSTSAVDAPSAVTLLTETLRSANGPPPATATIMPVTAAPAVPPSPVGAFPVPTVAQGPAGGLLYSSAVLGAFAGTGITDLFTIEVDGGQTLTLWLTPTEPALNARIELRDPANTTIGVAAASGPWQKAVINTVAAAFTGTYTCLAESVAGAGSYSIELLLNAALELESAGGASNDALSTAENLENSAIGLQSAADRLAARGQFGPGPDLFEFELSAGQFASLVLAVDGGDDAYPARWHTAPFSPTAMAAGDLDGDGLADVVVVGYAGEPANDCGRAAVWFTGADGVLVAGPSYDLPGSPRDVALADLDGDGDLDIVAACERWDEEGNPVAGNVAVALNDGSGSFGVVQAFHVTGSPRAIAAGDMNRDGKLDVVVASDTPAQVISVLLGDGAGGLSTALDSADESVAPSDVALGDMDGDGRLDVVLTGQGNYVTVWKGSGDGHVASPTQWLAVADQVVAVAVADVTGDGKLDVVTANGSQDLATGNAIAIVEGAGDGTLLVPWLLRVVNGAPQALALTDFDGDGDTDILTANDSNQVFGGDDVVSWFANEGAGRFKLRAEYKTNEGPVGLAVGTLGGESALDLVVLSAATDTEGERIDGISVHLDWPPAVLELLDGGGNLLARGVDEGAEELDEHITGFVAAAAGQYYARVSGGVPGSNYTLVITRGAAFELPPSRYFTGPQDITQAGQVLGSLAGSTSLDTYPLLFEGFEAGSAPSDWEFTVSGDEGRVRVTDAFGAASGSYAIAMDREEIGFGSAREDAIWTLDLSSVPDALVRFRHASYGYNDYGGMVVFNENRTKWTGAWTAPNQAPGVWEEYTVDVAAAVADAGFALGASTQVWFENYGYNALPSQGRLWDGIEILAWGDEYTVNAVTGDNLTFTLTKPATEPGQPENSLEARMDVLDAGGTVIASDTDLDGVVTLVAGSSGKHLIRVRRLGGYGDYVLRVQGATGGADPFSVVGVEPADGENVAGFPPVYRVHLSAAVAPSSVSDGDLLLNGFAATGVALVDGNTLEFIIATLNTGDGLYTAALAGGALTSVSGASLTAITTTFQSDQAGPKVISSAPLAEGGSVDPGDLTVALKFSEALVASGLDAEDVKLINTLTGESRSPENLVYDAPGKTLTITYTSLGEGAYTLRLVSSVDAFRDLFGNPLDGNSDGISGDDLVLHFNVDRADVLPLPTPLVVLGAAGAGSYALPGAAWGPGWVEGVFHGTGDSDTYTIALDAPQSLTVFLPSTYVAPSLSIQIEVRDPAGASLGVATAPPGGMAMLQSVPATTAGTYSIVVSSVAGASDYTLNVLFGAGQEIEAESGPANDSPAAAQALVPGAGGGRFAVYGTATAGADDWYSIDLNAGECIALAVASTLAGGHVDMTLCDAGGTCLALGVENVATNSDEYIPELVVPATGKYYVRIAGENETSYTLQVARGLAFEREPNLSTIEAQRLQTTARVAGWLDVPGYSLEPDDYASGTVLTTIVSGLSLTVDGSAETVVSITSDRRSTGSRGFGYGSSGKYWASTFRWLRIEFAQPVDMVAIDAIARDAYSRTWATLEAYDSAGHWLATVDTNGGASMNVVRTLAVLRPVPEIKYVRVSGLGGMSAGLDNLVVGTDKVDNYLVQVEPGKTLQLWTTTPFDGEGEPVNDLDPKIDVLDANNNPVATNDNGAPDLRNAQLEFVAGAGTYTVQVSGRGRGQYELHSSDTTLVNAPAAVISSTPAEASESAHAPAFIDLVFSEPLRADALDAAAFVVNGGGPATAAILVDGRTARYSVGLDVADAEGPYTYQLAQGACVDLQGLPSAPYTGTFFVDRTGPSVVSYNPAPATNMPLSQITLTFSEPVKSSSVSTADVVTFTGPGGVNLKSRITRLDVNGREVRVILSPVQTAEGTYTLVIGPNIEDYVGNRMDQDHDGVYGETTADRYTAVVDVAPPNLVAQGVVVAPSPAHFGQTVDISWTTRNAGRGEASGQWNLWVWLSTDNAISPATDWALKSMVSPTPVPLPALTDHPQTVSVTLPIGPAFADGTYYVLVQLDVDTQVYETAEADNTASVAVDLTLPRLPDLQVSGEAVPTASYPGGTVSIRWTVTNNGVGTAEQYWRDAAYMSPDAKFDEATDPWLFTYDAKERSPLEIGAGYQAAQDVAIPPQTAAGMYYVIVVTDRFDEQMETSNENNQIAVPLDVRAPDLVIDAVQTPAEAFFGSAIAVSWTVRNAGTYAAMNGWSNTLYLSTDDQFSAEDRLLATEQSTAALPFREDSTPYAQIGTVTLPLTPDLAAGLYNILVKADGLSAVPELDENNNFGAVPIQLAVPPLPDLTVSSITVPAEVYSGAEMPVEWVVLNQGTGHASGNWVDRVYVADNPAGTNGILLGEFPFTGSVAAGDEIARKKSVSLPYDSEGTWWVIVIADSDNTLYEHTAEGNNAAPSPPAMIVRLSPFPNLRVESIGLPDVAFNYQEIIIEWVVENTGTGPTTVPAWTDEVWLSEDTVFSPDTDTLLGRVDNPSYLAAGERYASGLAVTLPIDQWGERRVLVLADTRTKLVSGGTSYENLDQVLEPGHENDNLGASAPFEIQLTPPPDLQVTSVLAPPTLIYWQDLTIEYTVANLGSGATRGSTGWSDFVFLSQDEVVSWGGHDPTQEDICLGRYDHGDISLAPGENYSISITFPTEPSRVNLWYPLPKELSGDYYVIVVANWKMENHPGLFEGGYAGNNTGHPTFRTHFVATPKPDLEPVAVDMPATGLAGHEIMLSWTVCNNGPGSTKEGSWTEGFFLSTDQVWDAHDIKMATFATPHPPLAPDQPYEAPGFPLRIPVGVEGDYYLILSADHGDAVTENVETNNSLTSTHLINIISRPADLVATLISSPLTALAGQAIFVQWTVTNQGTGDTINPAWMDAVCLNPGERTLALVRHGVWSDDPMGVGASYTASAVVELPVDLEGAVGLYVVVDYASEGYGHVYEGDHEDNNTSPTASLNVVKSPSDLRVTGVALSDPLVAGQAARLEWTVKNFGPGFTDAEQWRDQAVLSTDQVRDADDLVLDYLIPASSARGVDRGHANRLAPDAEYKAKGSFAIPEGVVAGAYYLIVRTDNTNAVHEGEETNNDFALPVSVSVVPPSYPDLAVIDVTTPATASSGATIDVSWTVKNLDQTTTAGWS